MPMRDTPDPGQVVDLRDDLLKGHYHSSTDSSSTRLLGRAQRSPPVNETRERQTVGDVGGHVYTVLFNLIDKG
jgi:hypothetical protein